MSMKKIYKNVNSTGNNTLQCKLSYRPLKNKQKKPGVFSTSNSYT